MRFEPTGIDGAWIVHLEPRGDERGAFARVWCADVAASRGLAPTFVQWNTAVSVHAGTLRGLHYQVTPGAEAKLVRCIRGAMFDVFVDVRPGSASYGQWCGVELSAGRSILVYVPEGCAHGYLSLVDDTEVFYGASRPYAPELERGVRWNDPGVGIRWPAEPGVRHVSVKDTGWPDIAIREAEA